MGWDFIILGGTGLQGRICARDLLESGYSALLVGRDTSGIKDLLKNRNIGFMRTDLRNEKEIDYAVKKSGANVVVNCAEMVFNIPVMKAALKNGMDYADLGGLQDITREQFKMHNDFEKKGLLAVTGCGSTPGITNVMAARAIKHYESAESIMLGFAWDSNIKKFVIPYSLQSIFDEFTQPPVIYRRGKFVKENRMRCRGRWKFRAVGEQTAYCIVHSEVYSFARYFKDKNLKNIHYMAGFPEHSYETIKMLMDLGFSSQEEIEIEGIKTTPLEFTTRVLKKLPIPKGYRETEDLWVKVSGIRDGRKKITEMDCIIKTIKGWESAGSNVGTGRTASIISQMIKKGAIADRGVFAPEAVIPQKPFFRELAKRKMFVYENGKRIN